MVRTKSIEHEIIDIGHCIDDLFISCVFTDNYMSGLAQIKTGVRSKRVSSYDRSGRNEDYLSKIRPSEKRVIAHLAGSGIVNHIWITMSPEPKELNRNDIVIRITGMATVSVSSQSVGSIFRTGVE
ncbi:MAG: hypothetical protein WKF87_10015 [Chryseolinea sp.]